MADTIKGITLTSGSEYEKKDFGITGRKAMETFHTIDGKECAFFTIDNEDNFVNIDQDDGFVYEPRDKSSIPPLKAQPPITTRVFVREKAGHKFTFRGKAKYEECYSPTQTKIYYE